MANAKRATNLLAKLIRTDSVTGNELAAALIVEKEMKSIDMEVRTYEFEQGRPNVVGVLRGAGKKSLLLTPHIDTVPAGKGWKHEPFGAEIGNGKIYGRGSSDCKINVAACLEAARSIVESGAKLNGNLIIAVTVDEEKGSLLGLKPLLDKNIIKADKALVTDNDSFSVVVAQKGLVHFKISVKGKKAHGAYPWLGINAIETASKIICDLKKYKFKYRKHALLKEPTINIGTIIGGDAVNIVADSCEFEVDLRYLPGMKSKKIMGDFRKIIGRHAKRYSITIDNEQLPYEAKNVSDMVGCFTKAAKGNGITPEVKGVSGATPVSFFKNGNAIAVCFGAHHVAHQTDEYARIKDLAKGSKILEEFIKNYLGCKK